MAEELAHFGGGGLGEGDHQQLIHGRAIMLQAMQAAFHERLGLARAGPGHDQHIAARRHRALLRRRKRTGLATGGIHLTASLPAAAKPCHAEMVRWMDPGVERQRNLGGAAGNFEGCVHDSFRVIKVLLRGILRVFDHGRARMIWTRVAVGQVGRGSGVFFKKCSVFSRDPGWG